MPGNDTIAAVATPTGRGGVGIVRVSGPRVSDIASELLGLIPEPRRASYRQFLDANGRALDEGIALLFNAPGSYTGEDVLELQGHGGTVVMDMLLARVTSLGARVARPGEFTERAFLNNKLDLVQAEAVADLIDSGSALAARSAMASLKGEFSRRVDALVEALIELRMYVEAAIDFPEEEVDFLSDIALTSRIEHIVSTFDALDRAAGSGVLLSEGVRIVMAGKPNVGKSSLMNRFSGRDTSIVTDVPGTTRDVVSEMVNIRGVPVQFFDTAGIRDSVDVVEQEGVRRSVAAVGSASHTLMVLDASAGRSDEDFSNEIAGLLEYLGGLAAEAATVVLNKTDLSCGQIWPEAIDSYPVVAVSALTGAGMTGLEDRLIAAIGFEAEAGTFIARRRHLNALRGAGDAVSRGAVALADTGAGELLAEELRIAQSLLGEITGAITADDLLGRIFSSFCIGK